MWTGWDSCRERRSILADRDFPDGTIRPAQSIRRDFLLLDEPASGLDENEAAQLGEWIGAVPKVNGVCGVVSRAHNARFVMETLRPGRRAGHGGGAGRRFAGEIQAIRYPRCVDLGEIDTTGS